MNEIFCVLLIEDNPADADLIRETLSRSDPVNFQIESAATLSEALIRLKETDIDLIFLDLGLPDSFGLETFYDIHEAVPYIPIIILTGYDDRETGIAAVRQGAQDYLVKGQAGGSLLARAALYAVERKQAEIALRQAEEKYRSIFENAVEGISQVTPEGAILSANKSFARMLGYDSPETLIKSVTNISKQLYLNHTQRNLILKELEEKGEVSGYTVQLLRKDGLPIWVSISSRAVRDEKGEILYFESIIEDISKEQETKFRLLEMKTYYENILESIITGVWQTDRDDMIQYCNKAVLTITGFEQSKIIGSFIWDYLSGEKASAFGRLYLKAKALLEPVHYDIVPAVTSSGKPTYQSGWLIPLVKDGEFDGMICTVEDVTEQKLAHDALFQAEQKYRSIFENAVEGIFQSSPEGRFVSINPAVVRIHGYDSIEDMMNAISNVETKQLYVNPEQRKEYIRLLKDRGRVENFEAEMYKKDGTRIWTSMNVRAASDDAGNILYFEGTIEDITRRKHSEEKLVRTVESLRCAVNTTIQTLAAAVETKDPYTAGHQRQATDLARMIAAEMGLSADTIEGIRMACSIHDIGKISIPTEILSKPTKLSDIEFSLIKTHSESGYNMLKDVESPRPLADIVLQHHERMDGSGYPKGLKGDEILTEARIIAVADVVEAISSHRPYRPAKGIDAALKEIEHNAGILYDREVVEVCLRLFREKGFKFE
jgi:PAS domain S-box-containing protein